MPVFFNPAAGLTANRVPYALGGGRLEDSAKLTWDGSYFYVGSTTTDGHGLRIQTSGAGAPSLSLFATSATDWALSNSAGSFRMKQDGNIKLRIADTTGRFLLSKETDHVNGLFQMPSHSAFTGGLALGAEATGTETIWRQSAGIMRTGGTIQAASMGIQAGLVLYDGAFGSSLGSLAYAPGVITFSSTDHASTYARLKAAAATGWALPTATLSRATFDPATVTLPQLAERVAALITDLHISGTRHALLGL